jgi:hypothetical protein
VRTPPRPVVAAIVAVIAVACTGSEVFSLEVGQCFQEPAGESEEITDVEVVDCEEPHDNEAFHSFELEGDQFPGREAAAAAAEEECYGDAFEDYIGQPYQTSEVAVFTITPTRASWEEADDREIVCVAFVPGQRVEGSLQGSGR